MPTHNGSSLMRRAGAVLALVLAAAAPALAQSSSSLSAEPPPNLVGWKVFATGPLLVAMKVRTDGQYRRAEFRVEYPTDPDAMVGRATYTCESQPRQGFYEDNYLRNGALSLYRLRADARRVVAWSWWFDTEVFLDLLCGRPMTPAAMRTLLPDSLVHQAGSLSQLRTALQKRGYDDGLISEDERRTIIACGSVLTPQGGSPLDLPRRQELAFLIALGAAAEENSGPTVATMQALADERILARALGVSSLEAMNQDSAMARGVLTRCTQRLDGFAAEVAARLKRK